MAWNASANTSSSRKPSQTSSTTPTLTLHDEGVSLSGSATTPDWESLRVLTWAKASQGPHRRAVWEGTKRERDACYGSPWQGPTGCLLDLTSDFIFIEEETEDQGN